MNREKQDPQGNDRMLREQDRIIVFMPLQKNVPEPRNDWQPTTCPKCGQRCWLDTAGYEEVKKIYGGRAIQVRCTECALREK